MIVTFRVMKLQELRCVMNLCKPHFLFICGFINIEKAWLHDRKLARIDQGIVVKGKKKKWQTKHSQGTKNWNISNDDMRNEFPSNRNSFNLSRKKAKHTSCNCNSHLLASNIPFKSPAECHSILQHVLKWYQRYLLQRKLDFLRNYFINVHTFKAESTNQCNIEIF